MESIPFRRKLYCRHGIKDVMQGKGKYLLKEGNNLFLAQNNSYRESVLVAITYKDIMAGRLPPGHDEKKLWIISFSLKESQLSPSLGGAIGELISRLTEKGIRFRVSKPLPPCIFKDGNAFMQKHNLPLSCRDCLQMFMVDAKGKDNLFCRVKQDYFMFFQGGRSQCVELFKSVMGTRRLDRCARCVKKDGCGFWLWKDSCYNRDGIPYIVNKSETNNVWKEPNVQPVFADWWFLMNKWQVNFDIPMLQKLFKNRLKDKYLIDMGGAYGRNAFGLRKISKKTVLVDIVEDFFKYTKKRQSELDAAFPIVKSDIETLPFKNGSCDLIYSGGVLHSMNRQAQKKHLNECLRILKPGGLALGPLIAEWEVGMPRGLWPVHSEKKLLAMLRNAGFGRVWIYTKFRDEASPIQYWLFGALKPHAKEMPERSAGEISKDGGYSFVFNYWVNLVIGNGKIFALYDCQKKEYYIAGRSLAAALNLIARSGAASLKAYLGRRPRAQKKKIEDELMLLVKAGYIGLYGKEAENEQKKEG